MLILVSDHNLVQGLPKCGPRTPELVSFHFNEHYVTSLQNFLPTLLAEKNIQKVQLITFFLKGAHSSLFESFLAFHRVQCGPPSCHSTILFGVTYCS